jgi:hypothetical protein
MPRHIRSLGCLSIGLSLPIVACQGALQSDDELARQQQAVTSLEAQEPVVQRRALSSLGDAVITLSSGEKVRPGVAANASLVGHRELTAEVKAGGSALAGPVDVTEEFIETDDAAVLEARTTFLVRDAGALRRTSPRFGALRPDPRAKPTLGGLTADQRKWFQSFKAEMGKKPKDHPLGAAARKGDAELFDAAMQGQGDYEIVTRVRVPKARLAQNGRQVSHPVLGGDGLDFSNLQQRTAGVLLGAPPPEVEPQPEHHFETDEASSVSQFVNGFTEADAFDWSERWNFTIGHLELSAGAWYGFGLRIPIKVSGEITPADISHYGGSADVSSSYETKLSVDVIDADSGFYEKSGMDAGDIQDGKEFVLNAGAYARVDASLLGVLNADMTFGKDFDFGEDFRPPFDDCGTSCGVDVWLPSSVTKTGIDVLGIATGEARIGFNISGVGEVGLDYESLYDGATRSSTKGSAHHTTHHLSLTDTGPETFETSLPALASYGEKSFGYRVSNVDYAWTVEVTPGIRGDIAVNAWPFKFETTIGPFWLDFAKIRLGTVHFGHHDGTRTSHEVEKGTKSWAEEWMTPQQNPLDTGDFTHDLPETETDSGVHPAGGSLPPVDIELTRDPGRSFGEDPPPAR